tara:strand:- start:197 stop:502 length:306 start_codon:yes stop_codon:yes gene_type:complete
MSPLPGEDLPVAQDLFQELVVQYQQANAPKQDTQHLEVLKAAQPLLDFFREALKSNPPATATAFDGYVVITLADGTRTRIGEGEAAALEPGAIEPTTSIKI